MQSAVQIHYKNSWEKYPALDGVRGYAIVLVLLYHMFSFGPGWMGVDLFFVLSGFLITSILLDSKQDAHYYRNFYVRRILRIFPLYYAVLILLIGYRFMVQGWGRSGDGMAYIFYLQNLVMAFEDQLPVKSISVLRHFWSLAVEEHYYLFFPLLVRRLSQKGLSISLLAMIILSWTTRVFLTLDNNIMGAYVLTPCRLDAFAIGGLTALFARSGRRLHVVYVVMVTLCMAALVLYCRNQFKPVYSLFGYTMVDLFSAVVILLSLARISWIDPFFNNKLMQHIGKYAYGLYVFHYILWDWINDLVIRENLALSVPMMIVIVLVLTYVLARLSYRFIEAPMLRLKDRWAPRSVVP